MSHAKPKPGRGETEAGRDAPETATPEPAETGDAAEPAGPEVAVEAVEPAEPGDAAEQRVAVLEAEVAELKDQLLRTLAETENVRRRAQRERSDTLKYAAAPMLKDLLTVADNLSRAIESAGQGEAAGDQALQTLLAGVKLTEKELATVFERHHVVKLDPLGERLDPHRHEAMFEVPDPNQPSGVVVQVVEPGYLLHDRLLRPARVGVSKGAPATSAPPGAEAAKAGASEPAAEPPKPGGRIDTSV